MLSVNSATHDFMSRDYVADVFLLPALGAHLLPKVTNILYFPDKFPSLIFFSFLCSSSFFIKQANSKMSISIPAKHASCRVCCSASL